MPADLELRVRRVSEAVFVSEDTYVSESTVVGDGLSTPAAVTPDALSATGVSPSSLTLTPAP